MGDVVSLTVTDAGSLSGVRNIVSISNLVIEANGQPLDGFIQDISRNTDLVTDVGSYESELISLSGTVSGAFAFAGTGFEAAILSTQGNYRDNHGRAYR